MTAHSVVIRRLHYLAVDLDLCSGLKGRKLKSIGATFDESRITALDRFDRNYSLIALLDIAQRSRGIYPFLIVKRDAIVLI